MTVKQLLEKLEYTCVQGSLEKEVTAVVYDSRKIVDDCMFICIEGANFDGHSVAGEAAKKGAAVLITCKPVEVEGEVTVVQVENTRYAMAFISAASPATLCPSKLAPSIQINIQSSTIFLES